MLSIKEKIYAEFGGKLEVAGQVMQRTAIHPEITKVIDRDGLRQYLINFGLGNVPLGRKDNKYYLTTWETWMDIHKYDLMEQHKYLSDKRDCDDMADHSASRASIVYGLNTKGTISVAIYTLKDKFINYHRANIVICTQNGEVKLYVYDPTIGEKYNEIKKEGVIGFDEWWFSPSLINF